jgi:hypothetical protein
MSAEVSTGIRVADDPGSYLFHVIIDTEFDGEGYGAGYLTEARATASPAELRSSPDPADALATAVLAKISPDDYGQLLRAALVEYAPGVVSSYLDYLADEEGICPDCAHARDAHGGVATSAEPARLGVGPESITVAELIGLLEGSPSLDLPVYYRDGPDDSEETGLTPERAPIKNVFTISWNDPDTGQCVPAYVRIDGP